MTPSTSLAGLLPFSASSAIRVLREIATLLCEDKEGVDQDQEEQTGYANSDIGIHPIMFCAILAFGCYAAH